MLSREKDNNEDEVKHGAPSVIHHTRDPESSLRPLADQIMAEQAQNGINSGSRGGKTGCAALESREILGK
jgi:hypothetical protein